MDKRWRVAGLAGRCRTDPVRIGRWRRAAGAGQWDLLRAVLGPLVRQNSSRSGMAAGSCIDTNYGCLLCILPPRARPVFSAPFPSRPSSLRRSPLSPSIKGGNCLEEGMQWSTIGELEDQAVWRVRTTLLRWSTYHRYCVLMQRRSCSWYRMGIISPFFSIYFLMVNFIISAVHD
ncbi:hypothetical protein ACQJBY_069128 [Aegilops geniculata]